MYFKHWLSRFVFIFLFMTPIQFSHANGLPAGTYQYLFDLLAPYPIQSIPMYGHGQFRVNSSWSNLRDELLFHLQLPDKKVPVLGVGHSLGAAISLLSAIEQPQLFKQLILLEPPLVARYKRVVIRLFKLVGLSHHLVPHASKARKRRAVFESREAAIAYFNTKRMFQAFHPACFDAYIQHGLRETSEGLHLAFDREVESQVFSSFPLLLGAYRLKMPSYLVYGKYSDVLREEDIKSLKKMLPNTTFIEFDGGHLFPLEQPEKTVDLLKDIIGRND